MKTSVLLLHVSITALIAQGPLTPPPGANPTVGPANALTPGGQPQATMKSLHQVEPRTPLAAGQAGVTVRASGGFTITQPGSYYLTSNLTVDSDDGIVVSVAGVNLDLNGFLITGTGSGTNIAGIHITTPANDLGCVTLRNGQIKGNGFYHTVSGAISGTSFTQGIKSDNALRLSISGLTVDSVTDTGILGGRLARVESCNVSNCLTGIVACSVTGCTMTNTKSGIALDGLTGQTATNCSVTSGGPDVTGISTSSPASVSGCSVYLAARGGSCSGFLGLGSFDNCSANVASSFNSGDIRGFNGAGLLARGCTAFVSNTANSGTNFCYAFNVSLTKDCVAEAQTSTGSALAIVATLADACVIRGGAASITNRYNMP